MRAIRHYLLLFLLVVSVALPLAGCEKEKREARVHTTVRDQKAKPPVEKPAKELISTQEAFIDVSEKVTPTVVNISAARIRRGEELGPLFEEFFGDLFKRRPPPQRKEKSLGSGFILTEDGYILTNSHVVNGAEEIKVRLSDHRTCEGQIVGVDERTDVAVIKIEAGEPLPKVVLGDSDQIMVGQWALAIGNPFGLDRTLTVGVISAKGRADVGIEEYEDFIQTDASINPGNSGGPLLNIYGEVVGINTAIVASGQGIGFAIPINLAKLIADQLIEKGEVTRGWLGVRIQQLTPELAESFGLDRATGALVTEVLPDTPAARAGARRGDIILSFAGKAVHGVRELQLLVASTPEGETAPMEVLRDGKRLTLEVQVTVRQEQTAAKPAAKEEAGRLGLTVVPNEKGEGVLVSGLDPDGPAAGAGVRPGDVILSVNGTEVSDPVSYAEAAKKAARGKTVRLLIRRGEAVMYLAFTLS